MHYVVLELEVEHKIETPKDHSRVSKILYQIVNENGLLCVFPEEGSTVVPSITIDNEANAFQDAIKELDININRVVKDDTFVLCSLFSTWHIRVTIQREARDLGYQLPTYLGHPVIFDLKKEYLRWIQNHKNLLIKEEDNRTSETGEDEEITDKVDKEDDGEKEESDNEENNTRVDTQIHDSSIKNSDELMSQILQVMDITHPEDLPMMVNISISTELLIKLYAQCECEIDEKGVLTQPYDSLSDYNAFLDRESTTLYINNLPQDTTQSELESWFSQFGSRPIGFWTIKKTTRSDENTGSQMILNNCPYVEEPDSISGFIIFQTNQEAKEALLLNGRSVLSNVANIKQPRVVEHVVEIEPSCSSVLEKAHGVLASFPQSKNKPRPGDWTCPSCGFSNFQRRTACFRCTFPIPLNLVATKSHYNIEKTGGNSNNSNSNNNNTSSGATTANMNSNNSNIRSNGAMNHYINHNGQQHGSNGSNVPFRAGDWKCTSCQYHNFAKNVMCLRCNKPKIRQANRNGMNSNGVRMWETHTNNYLNQEQNRYSNNYNGRSREDTMKSDKSR